MTIVDGWRLGWVSDGWIRAPLHGANYASGIASLAGRGEPPEARERFMSAKCLPFTILTALPDHEAPHPDCLCGLHACDLLGPLENIARMLAKFQLFGSRAAAQYEPPIIDADEVIAEVTE